MKPLTELSLCAPTLRKGLPVLLSCLLAACETLGSLTETESLRWITVNGNEERIRPQQEGETLVIEWELEPDPEIDGVWLVAMNHPGPRYWQYKPTVSMPPSDIPFGIDLGFYPFDRTRSVQQTTWTIPSGLERDDYFHKYFSIRYCVYRNGRVSRYIEDSGPGWILANRECGRSAAFWIASLEGPRPSLLWVNGQRGEVTVDVGNDTGWFWSRGQYHKAAATTNISYADRDTSFFLQIASSPFDSSCDDPAADLLPGSDVHVPNTRPIPIDEPEYTVPGTYHVRACLWNDDGYAGDETNTVTLRLTAGG